MHSQDILKFVNFIYHKHKAKMYVFPQMYMLLYCFDEILTSRKPNMMTFLITGT